jgi:hypothetical protein
MDPLALEMVPGIDVLEEAPLVEDRDMVLVPFKCLKTS